MPKATPPPARATDASEDVVALVMAELLAEGVDVDPEEIRKFVADPAHVGEAQTDNDSTGKKTSLAADSGSGATPPATHLAAPGKPASADVALAGRDGKALARLIRQSQAAGVKTFNQIVRRAVLRYSGRGPLLSGPELVQLSDTLAAVNATADLLGRSRVREMADRASAEGEKSTFGDEPLVRVGGDVLATPEDAVAYFTSLYPSLGVDPHRYPGEQRRRAFTLAQSANQTLTERVQKVIAEYLRDNRTTGDAQTAIADQLDASGATSRNPQYAEMVFRTNAMDSFQTGMYEEGRHPDVRETFPCWQYLGIHDHRAGEDHRPNFDRYFPADRTFADVRGPRPFNCRCSMRWVDKWEWETLQSRGARLS